MKAKKSDMGFGLWMVMFVLFSLFIFMCFAQPQGVMAISLSVIALKYTESWRKT